ncbi:ferredoxin [Mumia zhuanghuii]|uniref:Ferredoxin n=2 Tax=Mumia TaxID=1546255 RepID=A0ABW1QKD6_9ACTN|nr:MULTISPECIES: ferredoxin [Mumia]KAA1423060.1 ferredoxin [Mumia zhuanghuii]
MKIKLDRTLCDGFGICADHAPETFSLDEWGYVSLVGTGDVAPEDEEGVRRALLDCPVHAILALPATAPPPPPPSPKAAHPVVAPPVVAGT